MRALLDANVLISALIRADVIVTGDADLLALEEHEGIAIVTPRAFLVGITPSPPPLAARARAPG